MYTTRPWHRGITFLGGVGFVVLVIGLVVGAMGPYRIGGNSVAQAAAGSSVFFPGTLPKTSILETTIIVHNTSAQPANVTMTFVANGNSIPISQSFNPYATILFNLNQFGQLPNNSYRVQIDADRPIQAMAVIKTTTRTDQIQILEATTTAVPNIVFAPIDTTAGNLFAILAWNRDSAAQDVQFELRASDGSIANSTSTTINPDALYNYPSLNIPAGFIGYMRTTSAGNVTGGISFTDPARTWLRPAVASVEAHTSHYIPRVLKSYDEGGGVRTTQLMVINQNTTQQTTVSIVFTDASGTPLASDSRILPPAGSTIVNPVIFSQLPLQTIVGAVISADQPLYVTDVTAYTNGTTYASNADTYGSEGFAATRAITNTSIPYINTAANITTRLSLMNAGNIQSQVAMNFYRLDGSLINVQNLTIPIKGWVRLDAATLSVPANFEGSVHISATSPLVSLIDYDYNPAAGGATPTATGVAPIPTTTSVPPTPTNTDVPATPTVTATSIPVDTTPPVVEKITIKGAATITNTRDVAFDVVATDTGGSGVAQLFIREYTFAYGATDPLSGTWKLVDSSGWITYTPNISYNLTLSDEAGAHYIQVWAADGAGNVSLAPVQDAISYQPDIASVEQDDIIVYRLRRPAGITVTVQLEVLSGNPDLYVWDIANAPIYNAGSDENIEIAQFVTAGTAVQIEVEGYVAGTYRLTVTEASAAGLAGATPQGRPRSTAITSVGVRPPFTAPPPPINKVHVPVVVRQ